VVTGGKDRCNRTRSSSAVLYGARARNDTAVIDGCFADDVVSNAPGTRTGRVPRRKLELFAAIGTLDELTGGTLRGGIHCVLANDHHVVVLQRTRGERAGRTQLEDPEVIVFNVRPQSRSSRDGRRP
jgi:hypothetical protein